MLPTADTEVINDARRRAGDARRAEMLGRRAERRIGAGAPRQVEQRVPTQTEDMAALAQLSRDAASFLWEIIALSGQDLSRLDAEVTSSAYDLADKLASLEAQVRGLAGDFQEDGAQSEAALMAGLEALEMLQNVQTEFAVMADKAGVVRPDPAAAARAAAAAAAAAASGRLGRLRAPGPPSGLDSARDVPDLLDMEAPTTAAPRHTPLRDTMSDIDTPAAARPALGDSTPALSTRMRNVALESAEQHYGGSPRIGWDGVMRPQAAPAGHGGGPVGGGGGSSVPVPAAQTPAPARAPTSTFRVQSAKAPVEQDLLEL